MDVAIQTIQDRLVKQEYREAVEAARDVVVHDPRNAQAWVFLGEGLERLGRKYEAWLAYERGWLLDPPAGWVPRVRERLFPLAATSVVDWLEEALRVPSVTLTAAFIVRDEERTLQKALDHIRPAVDDIVVVDTGSVDRTVEIAQEAGARVYPFEWCDDFSAARNFALAQVQTDWVLWVDGDEVLDPEDVQAPRTAAGLYSTLEEPVILRIVQVNQHGNNREPNYDMSRLHPTGYGIRWWGRIHEQLGPPEGGIFAHGYSRPVVRVRLNHDGYQPEVMHGKAKLQRNVQLLQKSIADDAEDVAAWGFLGRELYLLGRLDEAIDALYRTEQLAAKRPQYARVPEVRMFLIEALMARDRIDEALAVSERAVADSPQFPAGWYLKGKTEMAKALRLLRGAKEAFTTAQNTAPHYRGIVTYDAQITQWKVPAALGDVAKLLGDWVEARGLYERVLASNPALDVVRRQLEQMDRQIAALSHKGMVVSSYPSQTGGQG